MAEGKEKIVGSSREMAATNNLSLFPRDLLQRFMPASAEAEAEEEEEIELNLGLSLGGRFGVDRSGSSSSGSKKLTRSSSIVGTMPIFREEKAAEAESQTRPSTAAPYRGLTRTTSLPTETEEEWRKRKQMQTLRRMEAKRRRDEKRNTNIKTEANNPEETDSRRGGANTASSGLPRSAAAAAANKGGFLRKHAGSSRQGSVESQGGGGSGGGGGSSSSMSEFETKPLQASSSRSEEARSPNTTQSSQEEQANQEATASKTPETTLKPANALRRLSSVDLNFPVKEKSEMPCVFTKGEGPNGRRVDGILYRYGKGDEVRIMCVCHGSFLSPAEFVRHAGGGDVDHPLRHIVVNTASSSSLL